MCLLFEEQGQVAIEKKRKQIAEVSLFDFNKIAWNKICLDHERSSKQQLKEKDEDQQNKKSRETVFELNQSFLRL